MPRLFVGQVPVHRNEEDLMPIFSAFGELERVTVVRGPDNKSRGCAMVSERASERQLAQDTNWTVWINPR